MTQQISDFFQIKENEIWKLLTTNSDFGTKENI